MSTLTADSKTENPSKFFVSFACKRNPWASFFSFFILLMPALTITHKMVSKSYSQVGYPGATTMRIEMYVPEKLQDGSFDTNKALAIEEVSVDEFKKTADKLPYVFSSSVVRTYYGTVDVSVDYYAKSENGTHVYKTMVKKEIPRARSSWWAFSPKNLIFQSGAVLVNGSYEETKLEQEYLACSLISTLIFSLAIHFYANCLFNKKYPNWRRYD